MNKSFLLITLSTIFVVGCNTTPPKIEETKQDNITKTISPKVSNNFSNSKCNYTLATPPGSEILSNDPVGFVEDSPDVFVFLKGDGQLFNIACSANTEDLKSYAQKVFEMNKDDTQSKVPKTVGEIHEISFNQDIAYEFSLTGDYKFQGGGALLKTPITLVFAKHKNLIYEIYYPSDNKKSEEILNSFKFGTAQP